MIRTFAATNYLSIAERQYISFLAPTDASEFITASPTGKERLYKLAVFFGANASGKSNMLLALNTVFQLLFQPQNNRADVISVYRPFAHSGGKPTTLEVSFYAEGTRYDYIISFNHINVISEHLTYFNESGQEFLFYKRNFENSDVRPAIEFGNQLRLSAETILAIQANTLNNHSVLSTFGKVSLEADAAPFASLHNWLRDSFHDVDGDEPTSINKLIADVAKDEKAKAFYLNMLRKADFNIVDFQVKTDKVLLPKRVREQIKNDEAFVEVNNVFVLHHTDNGSMTIPLEYESRGTIQYMFNLQFLYQSVVANNVELIDEISSELHPDLLAHYLNVYMQNSNRSQLMFTSQNVGLLTLDYINDYPAMAIFAEKDAATGASHYTDGAALMADVEEETTSLYDAYVTGNLGAYPNTGTTYLTD